MSGPPSHHTDGLSRRRVPAVVVPVVLDEAGAAVQGQRRLVLGGDLQVAGRRPAAGPPSGPARAAPRPPSPRRRRPRYDLHGGDAQPADAVVAPRSTEPRAIASTVPSRRVAQRGEPEGVGVLAAPRGRAAGASPPAVVVRRPASALVRPRVDAHRRARRRRPPAAASRAASGETRTCPRGRRRPAAPRRARRRGRPRARQRDLEPRDAARARRTTGPPARAASSSGQAGVAEREHGVGPAGEAAGGPQQPAAQVRRARGPASRGRPPPRRRRRASRAVRHAALPRRLRATTRATAGSTTRGGGRQRHRGWHPGTAAARRSPVTYVIAQPCVDVLDKACIEECPVDCIYEGERMLYIHPDECVDCGACEPVCPVEAIFYEDDIPDQWKDYYKANVEFFDDLGLAGWRLQARQDRQGPPDRRRPAAAGDRSTDVAPTAARAAGARRGCRGFPWDTLAPYAEPRARRTRTASSTCPSARRSTRCPRSSRRRCARPPTPRATRRCTAPPRCATARSRWLAPARLGAPVSTPPTCCRSIGLQGARRLAAHRCSASAPGDRSWCPTLAYPTYEVGALVAGAEVVAADALDRRWARRRWRWSGSTRPSNPTGRVLPAEHLAEGRRLGPRARRARGRRDECYLELAGTAQPVSVLHPDVCGGSHEGCSPSTRCPSAPTSRGTAPGFVAGDPALVAELLEAPQARRDDRAGAGAGGDGRRARRRRARRRAAERGTRARRDVLLRGALEAPASGRALARRVSTCGRRATSRAGTPWTGWPSAASWSHPATSTAPPAPDARPGRAHRHRRASPWLPPCDAALRRCHRVSRWRAGRR